MGLSRDGVSMTSLAWVSKTYHVGVWDFVCLRRIGTIRTVEGRVPAHVTVLDSPDISTMLGAEHV